MSYGLKVKAGSKAEVTEKVNAEFAEVVSREPGHAADCALAQATAVGLIGVLHEPGERQDIQVEANGSLMWCDAGNNYARVAVEVQMVSKADEPEAKGGFDDAEAHEAEADDAEADDAEADDAEADDAEADDAEAVGRAPQLSPAFDFGRIE